MHVQTKAQSALRTREIIAGKKVSPEKQAMRNKKWRNNRAKNTSPDKKAKCNEDQRNYRAFSLSMECTITKFLQVVNQGQLYVCICWDQQYNKRSVTILLIR